MTRNYRPAPLSHGERARWRRLHALLAAAEDHPWHDLAARRGEVRAQAAVAT